MGLQHIHEMNMVHRDLKPANLMLVPAPGERTIPCGPPSRSSTSAWAGSSSTRSGKNQNADLTSEGTILGTPDYLAPEQARDSRKIDIRADIYSLGCVLYHLLTGQSPFPDKNLLSQMVRHATEPPRPLHDFNPAVPDGLQQIVNRMLAKQAAGRYPTPERAAGRWRYSSRPAPRLRPAPTSTRKCSRTSTGSKRRTAASRCRESRTCPRRSSRRRRWLPSSLIPRTSRPRPTFPSPCR